MFTFPLLRFVKQVQKHNERKVLSSERFGKGSTFRRHKNYSWSAEKKKKKKKIELVSPLTFMFLFVKLVK